MTGASRLLLVAGALASGGLLVLTFPGPDLGWLAWIALVPLLAAVRHASPAQAFRLGGLAGLVAYGGLMWWIRLFGLPAWILLSAGMAAFLGVFAAAASVLARRYRRHGDATWLWVVPVCWTAVEVLRSTGPLGFPWGLLGLTQYRTPAVLALAPFAGVFGIGAAVACVNAILVTVFTTRRVGRAVVVAGLLVFAAVGAAGLSPRPQALGARAVAAIQPNVPPMLKGEPATVAAIVEDLLRRTKEARAAGAEIIVYPETAVPLDLSTAADMQSRIARAAGGAVVVAGTYLPGPRNGALVLDHDGQTLGRYTKRRLVPFGEAGVVPGSSASPIRTAAASIGIAICYESAFSDLIRSSTREGADLLAVLTNDGWFGRSAGPAQHAAHAVLRAAEARRSVVRAANTGTSMLIGPDGTLVARQPLGTAGVLVAPLPVGGATTPYTRWGWLMGPLALAVALLALVPYGWETYRAHPAEVRRLVHALVGSGLVVVAARALDGDTGELRPAVAVLLLAVCAVVARGHLLDRRRVGLSVAVSLAVVAGLVAAMHAAYRQYGFDLPVGPADGRWVIWFWPRVTAGVAMEAWLRGAVFAAALPLGGWPLAVALPAALGVWLHAGQPQEVVFWHLFTGSAFGVIRLWTRDAVGLGPARGLGDAVVAGLAGLR